MKMMRLSSDSDATANSNDGQITDRLGNKQPALPDPESVNDATTDRNVNHAATQFPSASPFSKNEWNATDKEPLDQVNQIRQMVGE